MGKPTFTGYEKFVIAILALLQFTIILDFMILSPLGAFLIPAFRISPSQFGLVVSAYAFSAGGSGILAAGFADRFDRKNLLLFFYTGFLIGTLMCGLAPNYHFLLMARILTGLFGGVIGSVVLAISADLFPLGVRGRVMGLIQAAFSASQIMGIPIGLYLANHLGWHAPFFMIVGIGSVIGIAILFKLQNIDAHLKTRPDKNPFYHLYETVSSAQHQKAFMATTLLSTGGFMLMPFGSAFCVNNLGISLSELPLVFMSAGICSFFAGPLVGRLSDTLGKFKIFCLGSFLSIAMVTWYTHLDHTSLGMLIFINIFLYIAISSRIISSSALISAVPQPKQRGSFMAINSALQQFSGGLASALAGLIVVQNVTGSLEHFDTVGYIVSGATFLSMFMMYLINRPLAHADSR